MEPRYLLDTDICIYTRRRTPAALRERFVQLTPGEAAISIIVYGELMYGLERSRAIPAVREHLEEFTQVIPVLPLHPNAAARYGALRAELERRGQVIGNNDLWIAAHALAANLVLVTNNEREFRRVAGLKIENWAK